MRENGLTVLETIVKGKKETYQTPSCTIFSLYPESMLTGSVHGETKNEDVSEDEHDPWNTGQGK
ncbi:MAG: hypothetical protein HXN81_10060 [Prevotella pallens]|jgi:hypothetical protein|uniref:hypothetical protein n=1 Tax=Prevotella pallens TaxID=60133 RepID=UPI001CAB2A69|nr:hypothetical protein [Prevotella pallens]MBF1499107.1 hypothetical protein [Prevotella pallens]